MILFYLGLFFYGMGGLLRIQNSIHLIQQKKIIQHLFSMVKTSHEWMLPERKKQIQECIEGDWFSDDFYVQLTSWMPYVGMKSMGQTSYYLMKGIKCWKHHHPPLYEEGEGFLLSLQTPPWYEWPWYLVADSLDSQISLWSRRWRNEAEFFRAKINHDIQAYWIEIEDIYRNVNGILVQSALSSASLGYLWYESYCFWRGGRVIRREIEKIPVIQHLPRKIKNKRG